MAACLLCAESVYQPQAKWKDEPKPAFMSGPVIKIATGLRSALDALP
jgi:hypothetical protein